MTDLATMADVEEFIGRALTPEEEVRLGAILTKLSELFRMESGQQFTPGASEVRLKSNNGRVYLPQRPVVSVDSVLTDDGRAVPFELHGQWLWISRGGFVVVSYMHGSATVPDLVRTTIADAARQILGVSADAVAGVSQGGITAGPYSEQKTYATWAQGGSARLSPEDRGIARSFRVRVPASWSARPGAWPGDGRRDW